MNLSLSSYDRESQPLLKPTAISICSATVESLSCILFWKNLSTALDLGCNESESKTKAFKV